MLHKSLFKGLIEEFRQALFNGSRTHGKPACDLVIYDDCFPHPMSGFRLEEFTAILAHFNSSKAVLSGSVYAQFQQSAGVHQRHMAEFSELHPAIAQKMLRGDVHDIESCRLFYCVFLNNILHALPILEKKHIPFAFTLYPGGGFRIGHGDTDRLLKKVFSSPCFRKVIVTQRRTYQYLIDRGFCDEDDICFVFGVVVPQQSIAGSTVPKRYFPRDKSVFNLCFCSMRYTPDGADKGYPLFVGMMKALSGQFPFLRFHVIGNFDATVIDITGYEDRMIFHGPKDYARLSELFRDMDMIISPNKPDTLSEGAFDGFPLGTVVEAALNEVAVMLTDVFDENRYFDDGKDLRIINPNLDDIVHALSDALRDIDSMYTMAARGRERFRQIYNNEFQMEPRTSLLESLLMDRRDSLLTSKYSLC